MTADLSFAHRLNGLLRAAGLPEMDPTLADRFGAYLSLLIQWNVKMNLTAIRDEEGILSRHFIESIACAHAVPEGVKTLLDFGSGGGFPGIPIALCRPELEVTLAESQGKKAAFLQQALRTVGVKAAVYGRRAETLVTTFDCVVMRAVDDMEHAVGIASDLVAPGGWLLLMTTRGEMASSMSAAGDRFEWRPCVALPEGSERMVAIGLRRE